MANNPWADMVITTQTTFKPDAEPGVKYVIDNDGKVTKSIISAKDSLPSVAGEFISAVGTNVQSKLDGVVKALPAAGKEIKDALSGLPGASLVGKFFNPNVPSAAKDAAQKMIDSSKVINTVGAGTVGGAVQGAIGNILGGSSGSFGVTGSAVPDVAASTMVKLAKPIFTAGGSDTGATVDVYGVVPNSVQNNVLSVLDDVFGIVNKGVSGIFAAELNKVGKGAGILSNITNPKLAENVLGKLKDNILRGVPLTEKGMKETLFSAIGYDPKAPNVLDGLKKTGDAMVKDIVKNFDGKTGLVALYKDTKLILDGDAPHAEGMFKILDNITSNTKLGGFLDSSFQFEIINTVTKSMMNLGIPKVFDDIMEKITDDNKEDYIRENLAQAILVGDINFIEFALKYISASWIIATYPDIIKVLVSSYTPNVTTLGDISKEEGQRFITLLDRLNSRWPYVGSRNGIDVYNLEVFSQFNTSAKLALLAVGNRALITQVLVGESFGNTERDTLTELQKRYPFYPIA